MDEYKKPSQRKINSEITKMLRSYEALIADPENNYKKWVDYGSFLTCRMCKLMDRSYGDLVECCYGCPLGDDHLYGTPCVAWGIPADTHDDLYAAVREDHIYDEYCEYFTQPVDIKKVKKAAKARYKWILERLKQNGYEYK
jgi:hypothetical protein